MDNSKQEENISLEKIMELVMQEGSYVITELMPAINYFEENQPNEIYPAYKQGLYASPGFQAESYEHKRAYILGLLNWFIINEIEEINLAPMLSQDETALKTFKYTLKSEGWKFRIDGQVITEDEFSTIKQEGNDSYNRGIAHAKKCVSNSIERMQEIIEDTCGINVSENDLSELWTYYEMVNDISDSMDYNDDPEEKREAIDSLIETGKESLKEMMVKKSYNDAKYTCDYMILIYQHLLTDMKNPLEKSDYDEEEDDYCLIAFTYMEEEDIFKEIKHYELFMQEIKNRSGNSEYAELKTKADYFFEKEKKAAQDQDYEHAAKLRDQRINLETQASNLLK